MAGGKILRDNQTVSEPPNEKSLADNMIITICSTDHMNWTHNELKFSMYMLYAV